MDVPDPARLSIGLDGDPDIRPLLEALRWMREERDRMLGFPVNLDFDYRPLADLLAVHGQQRRQPARAEPVPDRHQVLRGVRSGLLHRPGRW
ncbi:hypothetical protein [Actinosynnema sp. NPDC023587]|uniref:hypothetical protein n=1 Tax=Actinosynnema sp. NPDC023587 TaxID=3154695 RepID=UPI0033D648E6